MQSILRAILLAACFVPGILLAAPVNINTADPATLAAEIKGVGEKLAAAIVAHREAHGPFKRVEDLADVKGIGPRLLEANRDQLVVTLP